MNKNGALEDNLDPVTDASLRRLVDSLQNELRDIRAVGRVDREFELLYAALAKSFVLGVVAYSPSDHSPFDPTETGWPVCTQEGCELPALFRFTWTGKECAACTGHMQWALEIARVMGLDEPLSSLEIIVDAAGKRGVACSPL